MTNMQAAIGRAQVDRLDRMVEQRRRVAALYNKLFRDADGVTTPPEMKWAKNVYWYYTILVDRRKRDGVIEELEKKGIETRPAFYPIHKLPVYKRDYSLPVSEELGARGINLPSGPSLTEEQIRIIAESVKKSLR